MKYPKKKEKNRIPVWKILLAVDLAIAVFVGGVWTGTALKSEDEARNVQLEQQPQESQPEQKQDETEATEITTAQQQEPANVASGYEVYKVTETDVVVPTPYGEICYPVLFEEFLRITHEFSYDQYVVHFNADIDVGEVVNLFSVYFVADDGKQPDGTVIGGFRNEDNGLCLVIVTVNGELPRADWDKDTANLVYAMQESITYCMERLERMECLIPAE